MKYKMEKNSIYFYFYDDFDFMKIQSIKNEVVQLMKTKEVKNVYFDFLNVSFVDSTGIGFVLARYRDLIKEKKVLTICNLSKEKKVVFDMSGVFCLIRYEENGV